MRKILIFLLVSFVWGFLNFAPVLLSDMTVFIPYALVVGLLVYALFVKPRLDKKPKKLSSTEIKRNEDVGKALATMFNAVVTATYNYAHCKYILISEPTSLVSVDGVIFNFNQILECQLDDDSRRIENTKKIRPSSGLGDFFDVVRVEKAIYAPTKTEVTIFHDYTIRLTLDSFTTPVLKIHLGADKELADQIYSIFKIMESRNKRGR